MAPPIHRLALWGDSVMKGVVLQEETRRYAMLPQGGIERGASSLGIDTENFSRFGYNILRGKKALFRAMERGVSWEWVGLGYGGNDCDFDWREVSGAPDVPHLPQVPFESFGDELRALISLLRERAIGTLLFTLPPLVPERYFLHITQAPVDPEIIRAWLGRLDLLYRWHESYSLEIAKIAGEQGSFLVDLRRAFLHERNYDQFLCVDGIHPNEAGQDLIARTVVAALSTESARPPTAAA